MARLNFASWFFLVQFLYMPGSKAFFLIIASQFFQMKRCQPSFDDYKTKIICAGQLSGLCIPMRWWAAVSFFQLGSLYQCVLLASDKYRATAKASQADDAFHRCSPWVIYGPQLWTYRTSLDPFQSTLAAKIWFKPRLMAIFNNL